jgi:hypothetical protein
MTSETKSKFPPWNVIEKWSQRKSPTDLDFLWSIVVRDYSSTANTTYVDKNGKEQPGDSLWPFLESCKGRSTPCLTICWAVEDSVPLTFKRGTDEWFVVMDEYDRQERKRSVEEQRRRANKPIATAAVVPAGVSENQDEIPF